MKNGGDRRSTASTASAGASRTLGRPEHRQHQVRPRPAAPDAERLADVLVAPGSSPRSFAGSKKPARPTVVLTAKRPRVLTPLDRLALQQVVHEVDGEAQVVEELADARSTGSGVTKSQPFATGPSTQRSRVSLTVNIARLNALPRDRIVRVSGAVGELARAGSGRPRASRGDQQAASAASSASTPARASPPPPASAVRLPSRRRRASRPGSGSLARSGARAPRRSRVGDLAAVREHRSGSPPSSSPMY